MKISLDASLERALLRAVAEGTCPPSVVKREELSKKGQAVHTALAHLFKRGAKPPIKPASIAIHAHSLTGIPSASCEAYLRSFKEFQSGEEIVAILQTAREKQALVEVINTVSDQLSSGRLDASIIARAVDSTKLTAPSSEFRPLASEVSEKFPKPPRGHQLDSLPEISAAINGIAGIIVIGGEPGTGKSTLSMQIAVDVSQKIPVSYHDIDGTGKAYFVDQLRQVFGDNITRYKRSTANLYYQDSVHNLDAMLAYPKFKPPGLIVIDSIQTLPTLTKNGKESTDEWLRRFKEFVSRGYVLLLISEKPRSHYGAAEMGGYKGTGDIEYSGTICAHLIADEDDDNLLRFIIVKNRHGPVKGHVVNLVRDDDKVFWFNEQPIRSYSDRRKKRN